MNKDERSLSVQERKQLVLSQPHLMEVVQARTQTHFRPDPEFEDDIERFSCLYKCVVCKQIPLKIKQCIECEAVICKSCKVQMINEHQAFAAEMEEVTAKCCPECKRNPGMILAPLKNFKAKAKLQEIFETHDCCAGKSKRQFLGYQEGADSDEQEEGAVEEEHKVSHKMQLTNEELADHLKYTCKANRKCFPCGIQFDTMNEFINHLKFQCDYVVITCNECELDLCRKEFKEHTCYENLHDVMEVDQQQVIIESLKMEVKKLREENFQLKEANIEQKNQQDDMKKVIQQLQRTHETKNIKRGKDKGGSNGAGQFPTYNDLKQINELLKEEIKTQVIQNGMLQDEISQLKSNGRRNSVKETAEETKKQRNNKATNNELMRYSEIIKKPEFELFDHDVKIKLACCTRTMNRLDSTGEFIRELLADKKLNDFNQKWAILQEFFTSFVLHPHLKNLDKMNQLDKDNKLRSFKRKYRTRIYNQSMQMIILLQEDCLKRAKTVQEKASINLYMGDLFHQSMKVATEAQKEEIKQNAMTAYQEADTLSWDLDPCDQVRLSVAINFQVYLYDQQQNADLAAEIGDQAVSKALEVIDDVDEDTKKLAWALIEQIRSNNRAFRQGKRKGN